MTVSKQPELLTSGSPARRIILFALPLLAGDFFQIFYSMTDAFILGRALGINALAATGCSAGLIHFVFGFSFGLTNGFSIITAQRVGSGDGEGIRKSVAAGMLLCLIFSLVFTFVINPFTRPLLSIMNTPPEILDDAALYFHIILSGISITLLYNMAANIIRAAGDSFSPLVFLVISTGLNIVLDILLVAVFHFGIAGAAAATVFSELVSAVLALVFLKRRYPHLLPGKGQWKLTGAEAKAHLSLGLAMGLQQSIVEVGNILVQTAMNGFGTLTIAAVSAAQRIRALNMMPLFAIARSITTYTAQNYGAKKIDRVYKGMRQACLICLGVGVFMAVINQFFGKALVSLFVKDNAEALEMGRQYLLYIGYSVFILGIMLVFRSSLQGLGRPFAPILCGVMETIMSILAAFVLIPQLGFTGLCLVNPLSWLASGIPLYIAFGLFVRKFTSSASKAKAA
ncbi:MATE family efflux transporter [Leadbettera azotonutricia]|uniref:MATE efflux family protein n=1 Tax=Leadbettera azotonutricia (strain ATCC BAA-888 / DSM 13862 / ZAS-9) TaxID=545695 RepID=F5Y6R9_LEAAZ|nr:MATE family efflux transporter [Leadbettera azotonutricia]AEF81954.1 MATE efflux family protein [Leadbettera azotonutricia ZAS-9]